MKTKEELNMLRAEVQALSKQLMALTEEELYEVTGGTDIDLRKDLYENIILGARAEDHNVMLSEGFIGMNKSELMDN